MGERLGVLGGSFDPIHFGHLRLAAEARRRLGLDRVLLVPALAHPLKAGRLWAPAEDRLGMARLAAEEVCDRDGERWLEVSDAEVRRGGASFTVDTLRALRREGGDEGELYFIAGSDVLVELERWYRVDEVLALARFAVATRPGYPLEVPDRLAGRLIKLEIEALEVSATEVRRRAAGGLPLEGLVPPSVARHIAARGLYRKPPAFGGASPDPSPGALPDVGSGGGFASPQPKGNST